MNLQYAHNMQEHPWTGASVVCGLTCFQQSPAGLQSPACLSMPQVIKMQENPNAIPEGETPHTVTLYAYDNMVDMCRPGDRVAITGEWTLGHGRQI